MFQGTCGNVGRAANVSGRWRRSGQSAVRPWHVACGLVWLVLPTLCGPARGGVEPVGDPAPPMKVRRYVERLISKYDGNGDGYLQPAEWQTMQGSPRQADSDGDGRITRQELLRHVTLYGFGRRIRPLRTPFWTEEAIEPLLHPTTEPAAGDATDTDAAALQHDAPAAESGPATGPSVDEQVRRQRKFFIPSSRLPDGLPSWFVPRDLNGDGQVTMAEFSPRMTYPKLQQFNQCDLNGDGLITAAECLRAAKVPAGSPPPAP